MKIAKIVITSTFCSGLILKFLNLQFAEIPEIFKSKLMSFGQQLQKISELEKKIAKCEKRLMKIC